MPWNWVARLTNEDYTKKVYYNISMAQERILVVDDEEVLCDVLSYNLRQAGYRVEVAHSAEEVLCRSLDGVQLLLLDVMMGPMSGIELAQRLKQRPETEHLPIIFCTACDTEEERIEGLMLGGDDYIVKPFSVREVVARVGAVLRRTAVAKAPAVRSELRFEGLYVDADAKRCEVDGEDVSLTRKEFEVLLLLLRRRGSILSREELLGEVWRGEVVVDRTVDVLVTRLRRKIGRYGAHIVTRHGYGYGFEA